MHLLYGAFVVLGMEPKLDAKLVSAHQEDHLSNSDLQPFSGSTVLPFYLPCHGQGSVGYPSTQALLRVLLSVLLDAYCYY